jgi:Mg-chelatase subunit ChlD
MLRAVERFNSKNLPLSNGSLARLSGASFDDNAAASMIGTPPYEASLWIPPLSPLTSFVHGTSKGDIEVGDCQPLMGARLGVALRHIDAFTLPVKRETLSLSSVLPSREISNRASPVVLVGNPRFSSSGLLALLMATAEVKNIPVEQVSPEVVSTSKESLAQRQERVRSYFIFDHQALGWLAAREGGDPIYVVTTDQALKAFQAQNRNSSLEWVPFASLAPFLDYPLCDLISKDESAEDLEVDKLARSFFSSSEFKTLASEAGFSSPPTNPSKQSDSVGRAIQELFNSWLQIRKPAKTTFVVDTSIKTDKTTMETIRRELMLFTESRSSKDDGIAIVSASSDQEVSRELTSDPELVRIAISRLTTTGGNAIRDGIETALSILEDTSPREFRRTVVVFTSANDTSSQTTVEHLTNRASQLVGRKNLELFVLAIGTSEQEFGELPALTRKVGGTFELTDIPSLPSTFYPITRRVQ